MRVSKFISATIFLLALILLAQMLIPIRGRARLRRSQSTGKVTVSFTPGRPVNTFVPSRALGAGVDGHERGDADRMLSPPNIEAMLSVGFKPLTYRLRTELAGEAWHWNPLGTWSDPVHQQGYFTSDSSPGRPISVCYGYRLPRRGNTSDQANRDDYSRLDDGDPRTFWKSNPYLDEHFTGEDNARHPQWVVVDFGAERKINALRILWAVPFATKFAVQYANFDDTSDISLNSPGMWRDFPLGTEKAGAGGDQFFRLSDEPIAARWVRLTMVESSHTAPTGSPDVRDRLGYAIREIYLGTVDQSGRLTDEIHHAADPQAQTVMHVSSSDPWHRATDLDERIEQPGFDRIFHSGLTNGLAMLTPVPLLYDTPENAAAEARYLKAGKFPVAEIEIGEEPDGQYVTPEDYGALYVQWAEALRRVDKGLRFGGPSFQEIMPPEEPGPYEQGNSVWLRRFLQYLQSRDRSSDFSFFSFEWYPFDDVCDRVEPQLLRAPALMTNALGQMERDGLSRRIPWVIAEYGYSAQAAQPEVDIRGALFNADIVGLFLTLGGERAYLYGYEPGEVFNAYPCTSGNNMLFLLGEDRNIRARTATYWGARLLTQEWAQPAEAKLEVYPASSDVVDRRGRPLVTAYALHRPDGLWALMLVNKDPYRAWRMRVEFRNSADSSVSAMEGPIDLYRFSPAQYEWDAKTGVPARSEPPAHRVIQGSQAAEITLPAYSLSVVRGRGPK